MNLDSGDPGTSRKRRSPESFNNEEEVDVPLSKRIHRLNIQPPPLVHPPDGFQDNYPYPPESTYYAVNHLLFNLHLERTQRLKQQQGNLPEQQSL
ncbi:Hypothetical protein FKW44_011475 [Caligus rogercresseyi]|uniref:Uncharacterized protein n=1 Tax=Caligus rogercresseyi TaxID=217165 RepID=A0A7T8HI25_CALRO|nr:Hypothetical protein FKW44_011475 [Caligus rogercresseyi]